MTLDSTERCNTKLFFTPAYNSFLSGWLRLYRQGPQPDEIAWKACSEPERGSGYFGHGQEHIDSAPRLPCGPFTLAYEFATRRPTLLPHLREARLALVLEQLLSHGKNQP